MNASAAFYRPKPAALQGAAEALRRVADVLDYLATEPESQSPRALARDAEVLLSVDQARELLGGCSRSHVERLIRGKACRRKAGRKVLIEREGLLALTRTKGRSRDGR